MPKLKVTALFDPNIDNTGNAAFKEEGLVEIIEDYNALYGMEFTLANHAKMKTDIADRLSHKETYKRILCTRQISQNPYPIRILPS